MDYKLIIIILSLLAPVILATRNLIASILILSSFLSLFLPVWFIPEPAILIIAAGCFLVFLVTFWSAVRSGFFNFITDRDIKKWRIFARPFAFLFIPIDIYFGHRFLVILLGYLALIFIAFDLYRLIAKKQFSQIFKKK